MDDRLIAIMRWARRRWKRPTFDCEQHSFNVGYAPGEAEQRLYLQLQGIDTPSGGLRIQLSADLLDSAVPFECVTRKIEALVDAAENARADRFVLSMRFQRDGEDDLIILSPWIQLSDNINQPKGLDRAEARFKEALEGIMHELRQRQQQRADRDGYGVLNNESVLSASELLAKAQADKMSGVRQRQHAAAVQIRDALQVNDLCEDFYDWLACSFCSGERQGASVGPDVVNEFIDMIERACDDTAP